MRASPLKVSFLVAALVMAGCGTRASKAQIDAARKGRPVEIQVAGGSLTAAGDGGTAAADTGGAASTDAGGAGTGTGTPAGGAATAGKSAAGTGTAVGAGTATTVAASGAGKTQAAGATTTTVAAGDNGGATDVGVTADSITLGNVSTLSGPVPGLFEGAVIGTQAAIAYQNSLGGVHGRKLKLDVRDDQFDTGQNRAQTNDLIGKTFAMLGSFSLYDDASLDQLKASNIPDLTYSLSEGRRALPNNFSVQPGGRGWRLGPLNYFKQKFPDAVTKVGAIYGDVPASKSSYDGWKAAAESVGYKIVYDRGTQPTETDFTADVVRMRQAGVKMVYLIASDVKATARLAKAMAGQNFKVDAFVSGGVAYDPALVPLGGDAVEGIYDEQQMAMFSGEDAGAVPEVALLDQWAQKIKPNYKPDLFAVFGWAETRLFVQALQAAGPKATRASLLDAVHKIDSFDSNGLLAPAGPATKRNATCYVLIRVQGGKFVRFDSPPSGFRCNDGGFFKAP